MRKVRATLTARETRARCLKTRIFGNLFCFLFLLLRFVVFVIVAGTRRWYYLQFVKPHGKVNKYTVRRKRERGGRMELLFVLSKFYVAYN